MGGGRRSAAGRRNGRSRRHVFRWSKASPARRQSPSTRVRRWSFSVLLCVLLVAIQTVVDRELDRLLFIRGCICVREDGVRRPVLDAHAVSCEVPATPRSEPCGTAFHIISGHYNYQFKEVGLDFCSGSVDTFFSYSCI
ncbi:hypothetical protein ACQ4PT_035334 [Festuca glaucescens]